jgi:hypothetical protein
MKLRAAGALMLVLFSAGCGGHGATEYRGQPSSAQLAYGLCAFCHDQLAVNLTAVSADLKCTNCHDDLQPGRFGPGHRARPGPDKVPSFVGPEHDAGAQAPFGSCAFCHNQFAVNMTAVSADLRCTNCHDDLQPGRFGPGHRARPGPDRVPSFASPSHQLGAQAGFGFCAFCHNEKAVNMMASGVDIQCEFCHETALAEDFGPGHRSLPGPDKVQSFVGPSHQLGVEARFSPCAFCHNELAVKAAASAGHGRRSLDCVPCHADAAPGEVGPGHRRVPACADCHSEQQTHQDSECVVCHTPHGSANLYLVREQLLTPSNVTRDVQFTNIYGLADGSFASVSRPGTGVCETCHGGTRFYRSDGAGEPHVTYPCFTCHPHALGFALR